MHKQAPFFLSLLSLSLLRLTADVLQITIDAAFGMGGGMEGIGVIEYLSKQAGKPLLKLTDVRPNVVDGQFAAFLSLTGGERDNGCIVFLTGLLDEEQSRTDRQVMRIDFLRLADNHRIQHHLEKIVAVILYRISRKDFFQALYAG